jgi:hypothetical protein
MEPGNKRRLSKHGLKFRNIIKMNFEEVEFELFDWIELTPDGAQLRSFVNMLLSS